MDTFAFALYALFALLDAGGRSAALVLAAGVAVALVVVAAK